MNYHYNKYNNNNIEYDCEMRITSNCGPLYDDEVNDFFDDFEQINQPLELELNEENMQMQTLSNYLDDNDDLDLQHLLLEYNDNDNYLDEIFKDNEDEDEEYYPFDNDIKEVDFGKKKKRKKRKTVNKKKLKKVRKVSYDEN